MFKIKLLAKYVIGRAPNFAEHFELDGNVLSLLQDYPKLWDDLDVVSTAKVLTDRERADMQKGTIKQQSRRPGSAAPQIEKPKASDLAKERWGTKPEPEAPKNRFQPRYPEGTEVKLKSSVQSELLRIYTATMSAQSGQEGFENAKIGIKQEVNTIIKKVAKDLKIEPRGIQVEVDIDEQYGHWGGTITISYKGATEEIQPEGLYYSADTGANLGDAIDSDNTLAWLGHDGSPFHDSYWTDAVAENDAQMYFREAGSIESDEDRIEKAIKDVLVAHKKGDAASEKSIYKARKA